MTAARVAFTDDLDAVDRQILALLIEDARRPVAEIAQLVNLTSSPTARRIDRMERMGIITGYTAIVDYGRLESGLEVFAELRFAGNTKVDSITRAAANVPEVMEILTVAGDPDALIRFRASSVDHLADVIDRIRRDSNVIGTKTFIVLGSWKRPTKRPGLAPSAPSIHPTERG